MLTKNREGEEKVWWQRERERERERSKEADERLKIGMNKKIYYI